MSNALFIDPGIRGCGVSLYSTGYTLPGLPVAPFLKAAAYLKNPSGHGNDLVAIREMARAIVKWAPADIKILGVEWPQIYAGRQRGKKDPNDLPPLAGIDAALFTMLNPAQVEQYLPREWKGTIDPDEMIRRIKNRLYVTEFDAATQHLPRNKPGCTCWWQPALEACASESCKWHNVWDAIGIGLKYFGRLEKVRIIHR